jgi:hypothetical protein
MIDLAIDGRVFIQSELDEALQELDLLFNTVNTELIGYPTYGTNFEQFLWRLSPSASSVEKYIREKIQDTYFLARMETDISVEVTGGEIRDIYMVYITVTSQEGVTRSRTYSLR